MKILLISSPFATTPPKAYGGTQMDVAILGEELAKSNEVTIVASDGSCVPGCKIIEAAHWSEGSSRRSLTEGERIDLCDKFWRTVIVHLKNNRYDVINSHLSEQMPYYEILYFLTPLCTTIHCGFSGMPRNNIFISPSQLKKSRLKSKYIYNPVDVKSFEFKKEKKDYLSFLARVDIDKGILTAISVSKKLNKELIIAGPVYNQSLFDKHIKPFIGNGISYAGQVGGKQKNDLLGNSQALLYPSIFSNEALGMAPLEANACGTPVIAFKATGLIDSIKDGVNGFLVKNEEEMICAVKKINEINPLACRDYVDENFNPTLITGEYVKCYKDLINGDEWE